MADFKKYFGKESVENAEDKFYEAYLEKALGYLEGDVDGVQMKQLSVACGNIAKMRQTRSSTASLKYRMDKDGNEQ